LPARIQTYDFAAHARKEQGINVHENPSNGRRYTTEKLHCSSSKVPFINDDSTTILSIFVT